MEFTMKFKTILALCLFAFSPLALASNHAHCDCCHQAKHEKMHDAKHKSKHESKHKICKDVDHEQHAKHMTMSPQEHAKHKLLAAKDHKDMGKMCDTQCEECCNEQCEDCGDCGDCKQCSIKKPDMQHQGH